MKVSFLTLKETLIFITVSLHYIFFTCLQPLHSPQDYNPFSFASCS